MLTVKPEDLFFKIQIADHTYLGIGNITFSSLHHNSDLEWHLSSAVTCPRRKTFIITSGAGDSYWNYLLWKAILNSRSHPFQTPKRKSYIHRQGEFKIEMFYYQKVKCNGSQTEMEPTGGS